MIYIDGLTKIYRSSNRRKCLALDHVTFSLPDKGMIFVVGKSGSGKSTLLNLLGGLDEITEGDITVDGLKFSQFRGDGSFDGFRNRYTGFIFQDFHLLSKLTVEQNVRFALELKGEENDPAVADTLRRVGLVGYENRYPEELSGGQQQRVAIARAIVKDPRLILADEPTGNLDSVTSEQILVMLKELSRDRLVVIVSHNMDSARQYGDRIIEMGGGRIVKDITRNDGRELPLVRGRIVTLPDGRLSDEQLKQVNAAIYVGGVRLHRQSDIFVPTEPCALPEKAQLSRKEKRRQESERRRQERERRKDEKALKRSGVNAKSNKLTFKNVVKFGFKFMNIPGTIASVLITSFTVVLFVICMMLYGFDSKDVFKSANVGDGGVYTMQKQSSDNDVIGMLAADKLFRVEDGDIEEFKAAGYKGNIYKLYNMSIPTGLDSYKLETGAVQTQAAMYKKFYSREALGVLVTEESYLKKIFGDYKVLAGDPYATPYGVIITDYFADSLLIGTKGIYNNGPNPYNDIVTHGRTHNRYCVNAVIDTGYKQRYAELLDMFAEAQKDGIITSAEQRAITGSELYANFVEEAQTKLNIAYSFAPDYIDEVRLHPKETRYFARILNAEVYDESGQLKNDSLSGYGIVFSSVDKTEARQLKKGEAYITLEFYNKLFDKKLTMENWKKDFKETTITIRDYNCYDLLKEEPMYEKTFTLKGICQEKGFLYISDEDFDDMRHYDVYCYSLMFDSDENIEQVMTASDKLHYVPNASLYSDLLVVARVMQVYSDLFLTLALVLLAVGTLVLLAFGVKSVRSRTYEIGIMKALGTGQSSISFIFLVQMMAVGLAVCVVELVAQFGMIALANSMLAGGLAKFLNNSLFKRLTLLTFDPAITGVSLIAVLVITLIAVLVPLLLLGNIKPIKIIKKKD